jgi:hypothetical protein
MLTLGWREWIALPELGIPAIKAKIDTGARTSALHAFYLETFHVNRRRRVRFGVHPLQRRVDLELFCETAVVEERYVTDSGGHGEQRLVIHTPIVLGDSVWPIEITLTNRDPMMFRMLLGRTALERRFLVDPARSYTLGRDLPRAYLRKKRRKRRRPSSKDFD